MSVLFNPANTVSDEVIVITSTSRGLGFMTVVPAKERDGKLVLCPRDGESLSFMVRTASVSPRH